MSKLDIILLDNENIMKEKICIIKPRTYQELLKEIKLKLKEITDHYEMFVVDKNYKEIKIFKVLQYEIIDDLLFIRDKDRSNLKNSFIDKGFISLSESKQEFIEDKFGCVFCTLIIKNENPYLCYKCQKIFHEKCLKDWDKKCKSLNNIFSCPNCRYQLPLEKWNKQLNHDEKRNYYSNVINEIHELFSSNNINRILNRIKDNKIEEFRLNRKKQIEQIKKYKTYLEKNIKIFNIILNQINLINSLLKINKNNNELNTLINMLSSNIDNTDFNSIYKIFNDEFEAIKKNINYYNKNYIQKNLVETIMKSYKIVSKEIELNIPHKIQFTNLNFTFGPLNNLEITQKKSIEKIIQTNEELPKNIVKNDFKQKIIEEIKNKKIKEKSKHISGKIASDNNNLKNINNINTNYELYSINDFNQQKEYKNTEIKDNIPKALTTSQINNIINMSNLPETFGSANFNEKNEEKNDYNVIDIEQKNSIISNINNEQLIYKDNEISQNADKMPEEDYSIYFKNSQAPIIFDSNLFGEEKKESNIFQGSNIISQQFSESEKTSSHYEENNIPAIEIISDNYNYNQNSIPIEYNYNFEYNFDNQQLNTKDNDNTSANITETQNYTSANNFMQNNDNHAKVTKVSGEDTLNNYNNDMTTTNVDFGV